MGFNELREELNKLDTKAYAILIYFSKKRYKKFINSKRYVSIQRKWNKELNRQIGLLQIHLKTNK